MLDLESNQKQIFIFVTPRVHFIKKFFNFVLNDTFGYHVPQNLPSSSTSLLYFFLTRASFVEESVSLLHSFTSLRLTEVHLCSLLLLLSRLHHFSFGLFHQPRGKNPKKQLPPNHVITTTETLRKRVRRIDRSKINELKQNFGQFKTK